MKTIAKIKIGGFMLIILMGGYSAIYSQEAESNAVQFRLNNMPDTQPPVVKIISPVLLDGGRFQTEVEKIDLIGEVEDESKIRFVSVNTEIRLINETGIFASSLSLFPGENIIQIRAMDEHNNLMSQDIVIEYLPPVITLADRIHSESKYYGLFIGIEEYGDPEIPNLENPINDATSLKRSLTTRYTFEEENILFLENPTRSEIIRGLDELQEKVDEKDNLLIFYAGHGYWDEDAQIGYWLPSNATRKSTVEWFRNSTLVDYLQAIDSKHTLLITDACFAGSIFRARSVNMDEEVVYETLYEMPSRKAMTSGAMSEVPDRSPFLKYLIERLEENEELYLSSEELFSSFRMAVISNCNVVPQIGVIQGVGNEGGDFIFLKRK